MTEPACVGCEHLGRFNTAPYCKAHKKFILPDFPPMKCPERSAMGKVEKRMAGRGKIIIELDGDTARVEMWRAEEGEVSCARFTANAVDILSALQSIGGTQ